MSNELERAYDALSRDAGRARLLPAAELRGRARRQTVVRSAAGLVAVAVLAAGVTAGTRFALAGGDEPQPILPAVTTSPQTSPSQQASPSPSAASSPPASSPPASPSSPGTPAIPKSVPARALLTKADSNTGEFTRHDEPRTPPRFCADASYPSEEAIGVRASVTLLYRSPELSAEYTPEDEVHDTVTVYRGDGAERFMDDLRDNVRLCPTGKLGDLDATFRGLGSLDLGDESLLVERSTAGYNDDGTPSKGKRPTYIAAVRVGDSVTLLETLGYESAPSDRDDVESLTATATVNLAGWRQ
ncbi:hypothetical protein FB565_003830 [Actinoplanes lutulentus]|uniref:PknH-like protein n=1 Tax=Actinoplanes lutulentus TaxID=1287878 RepID=A0A327ZKX6_9ACTN|nr:hypothetical protein [Actinoplanes lutulentus]MBB2944101.1 hypothetical protein [Actinoplanes lutulentus]RAK42666.1 hypothetical protein B0I29_102491 [Actinoplanes lutulentus]